MNILTFPLPRLSVLLASLCLLGVLNLNAQTIPNASFESPGTFTSYPGYSSSNGNADITGWTMNNRSQIGLNTISGPFLNFGASVPNGTWVAFIQSSVSNANTLSTTITGLTVGATYKVTFAAGQRSGYTPPTATWSLNGGSNVSFSVVSDVWTTISGTFTATGSTASLSLTNQTSSDSTLLLDNFTISPAVLVSSPTSASNTGSTAILGGNVVSDEGSTVTERGVVYSLTSTNSDPVIGGAGVVKVTASGTTGVFTTTTGALTAGAAYSYKAYATNSLGTGYSPGATFTTSPLPSVSSGTLLLHLDAGMGVATSGSAVTTWTDQSPNGYVFNATGSPQLVPAVVGGHAAVRFDGSTTRLESARTVQLFTTSSSGLTVFTSFSTTNNAGQKFLVNQGNVIGSTFELGYATGNGGTGNFGVHRGSSNAAVTANNTIANNTWYTMALQVLTSGTAPANINIFQNGTAQTVYNNQSGWLSAGSYSTNATTMDIGVRNNNQSGSFGSYHAGDIASIVIYQGALNSTDRQSIETALSAMGLPPVLAPIVTTPTSSSITASTATLGGNVTTDNGGTITERGVVYSDTSTNSDPAIGGTGVVKVTASGTTGVFTAGITGLTPDTGYSYKAYATNSVGTTYTSVDTFTTALNTAPSFTESSALSTTLSPVSWWRAENNANDSAGSNNGTLQGSAGYAAGKAGQAFSFGGSGDYVRVPTAANLNFGASTDFTLEAWVNLSVPQSDYAGIIAKADGASFYQLLIEGNKLAGEFYCNNGSFVYNINSLVGASSGLQGTTVLTDGNWHHVAMVVSRSTQNIKLYVDGNEEASVTSSIIAGNVDNTGDLFIGVERGQNIYLNGLVDEPAVYNSALSVAQVQSIYNAGSLGKGEAVVTVLEDSGAYTGGGFITNISAGGAGESYQTVSFDVTNDNNALFSVQPAIATDGTLTFTPEANANGTATVTVDAMDDGGTSGGGTDTSATQTFVINVTAVNDAPTLDGPAGGTWVARDSSRFWTSAAASSDGTKIVAAARFGEQLYTSTDSGATWTARDSNRDWIHVASSSDGTKLVALDQSWPGGGSLYTSTDSGVTWTAQAGAGTRVWSMVASSADGTKLVAAANNSQLLTSTDSGVTWTARATSEIWFAVASSADGTKLAAAVQGGGLYTSTDSGVTWTLRSSAGTRDFKSIASSADGTKLVAAANGDQLLTSTDSGVTWTSRDSARSWVSVASSSDGVNLLACEYGGRLYVSTDSGVTWTAKDSDRSWNGVAMSANAAVMVGAPAGDNIYVSTASLVPLTIAEDAGTQTVNLTGITSGAANESQTLVVTATSDNTAVIPNPSVTYTSPNTTGSLSFAPVANANGSATITVTVTDDATAGGTAQATSQTFTVTVTPVNDAPTLAAISKSGTEDITVTFAAADFTDAYSDVESDPLSSITVETLPATGTLQLSGIDVTASQVIPAASLGNLAYVPAANENGAKTFTVTASDGSLSSAAATVTMTLAAVNDAPSFALPSSTTGQAGATWTARESTRVWYSMASSADGTKLAAGANTGLIYTSTDSGVTWTGQTGSGSRLWSGITSSADGTKLAATVTNGQIYTSTDSGVTWTARDSNRSWTGITSSSDGTKLVATASSNKIYTSTDSGVTWTAQDSIRAWNCVACSSDGTKLVAAVDGGLLYTSTDSGVTWTAQSNSGSRYWRAVASSADGTKLVAGALNGQIYTSTDSGVNWTARESNRQWVGVASSADGTWLAATAKNNLVYTSADSGVTWTGHDSVRGWWSIASSSDGSKLVSGIENGQIYTSVGTLSPFTVTVAEDAGAQSVSSVATSISPGPADESAQTVSFTVTNDNNALFSAQPAIGASGTLTFTSALNANGSATVSVTATDSGGASSSPAQTFTITVTPVNDAPTLTSVSTLTGAVEDTAFNITYATLAAAANEADVDGDTLAFRVEAVSTGTLTKGGTPVTPGSTLLSTGETWVWTPAADANGALNAFTVTAYDGALASAAPVQVTVNVTAVNDAPVITSNGGGATASINVAENSTAVTTVTATDVEVPATQTLTYSKSGTDAALFTLNSSTGVLTFTTAPNYEQPQDAGGDNVYNVTVTVTDNGSPNLNDTQDLTITVTNVNEAPSISSSQLLYETVTPIRSGGTSIVYSVNNAAALAGTTFSRVRYRMETQVGATLYYADVGFDAWAGLTISGLQVPSPAVPFSIQRSVTNMTVDSNVTGLANASDVTTGSGFTGHLEIWPYNYNKNANLGIGGSSSTYDFDDTNALGSSYGCFQVHNLSSSPKQTVLAWNNHNGPPDIGFGNHLTGDPDWTFSGSGGTSLPSTSWKLQIFLGTGPTLTLVENQPIGTSAGTFTSIDPDAGDTATYSLVAGTGGDDNASFTISGNQLLSAAVFNYEAKSSYNIRVRVTDSGGAFSETAFTVAVTNVNDAPVITSNGGGATASIDVAENTTTVTTVAAADDEVPATQTLTYSKSGADAALFTLDSSTGALTFTTAPNYEQPQDVGGDNVYNVTVTATDNGSPVLYDSQDITVNVTNVDDIDRAITSGWTQSYGGPAAPGTRSNGDAKAVAVYKVGGLEMAVCATGYTTNAAGNKDIYTACYSPADGTLLWEKLLDGAAGGADEGTAIAVDPSGNVIVTGYTTNASGNTDVITAKYAQADGTLLWQKIYNGAGNSSDVGFSVAADASGNVAVAGYGVNSSAGMDVFAARYSSDGGTTYFEQLVDGGGSGTDQGVAVAVDSTGSPVVTGFRTQSGAGKDLLVLKLNATSGATTWSYTVNGSSNTDDIGYALAVDGSDAVVVTGTVRGVNYDLYTAKLSSAGSLLWANQWNSSYDSSDAGFAVALDSQGNAIVAGHSYTAAGVSDGYVAKYSSGSGTLLWDYRYNGPDLLQDDLSDVAVDGEDNVIATGYSQTAGGTYDAVTFKLLSGDGDLLWTQFYNGAASLSDVSRSLAVTANGQAFIAGYSTAASGSTDFLVTSYGPAVPGSQTSQVITFANPGPQSASTPLTLAATADSGLVVHFAVVSGPAEISGGANTLLTFTGSGDVTVRASQSGNDTYAAAAPVDQTFTVSKASQTISFVLPAALSSTAQWPLTGVASSGLAVTYSVQSGPGSITGGVLSFSGAGDVTVRASQAGDGRYNAAVDVDAVVTAQNHTPVVILDNITENWRDTYAGSGDGAGNDIALQLSGNDAVAGFVGGYTTTGTGKDLYLVKYLADGTLEWSVTSRTAGDDEAMSVIVDGNGDVVVAGYVTGTGQDLYVAKFNGGTGSKIWEYTYSGTGGGNDVGVSLALDGTTNVVVGGYVVGSGTSYDFFAAKLNLTTGAAVWASAQNRTGTTSDIPAKVAVGTDGSVALAGATNSDAWTVKLADADGALVWQVVYNYANKPDAVRGLALDAANNVIITAYSQAANYDMYTAKYASLDGTLIWGKRYNSSFNSSDHPWDLAVDEDSNVFVTGASYRAASVRDGMTLKYAGLDGTLLWEGRYNGASNANDENSSISLDGIGNPVISGYTTNADGSTDVYLAKHNKGPGTIRWQNTFDGANNKNDSIHRVKVDPNGNVWMAGSATTAGGQLQVLVLRDIPTL